MFTRNLHEVQNLQPRTREPDVNTFCMPAFQKRQKKKYETAINLWRNSKKDNNILMVFVNQYTNEYVTVTITPTKSILKNY